jgi:hypothetical protein
MKKFLLIAAAIGVVALVVKKRSANRTSWQGLSEDEARQRLNDRFPDRMPEDKREVVTDKIVSKMRDKGVIVDLTDTAETADLVDGASATEGV